MKKGFRLITSLLLVLILLFSKDNTAAAAELNDAELDKFISDVQAVSDTVTSFSSAFTQEKHLAMFHQPVLFQGNLSIVRPDKLRWVFSTPIPSVLVFKGNEGIRCNDKAPPVRFDLSKDPVMKIVAEHLWLWLGGDYSILSTKYSLERKGSATLFITARDRLEYISSVEIQFNKDSFQPEQVTITEPGGDYTRIVFLNPVINHEMPDSFFSNCEIND